MIGDPFAGMVSDLFASVLAVEAVYTDGAGFDFPVRAIVRAGVAETSLFDRAAITETILLDLPVSEVTLPQDGETVEIGETIYTITGQPRCSADRLIWTCETDGGHPYAP